MIKLPRKIHGFIDYLSVLFMLSAPWLFAFDVHILPTLIFTFSAITVFSLSLYTNYELGWKKRLPMEFHLDMDMSLGLFLAASPWLLNFYWDVYLPHVIMGCFAILAGLVTERNSLHKS